MNSEKIKVKKIGPFVSFKDKLGGERKVTFVEDLSMDNLEITTELTIFITYSKDGPYYIIEPNIMGVSRLSSGYRALYHRDSKEYKKSEKYIGEYYKNLKQEDIYTEYLYELKKDFNL